MLGLPWQYQESARRFGLRISLKHIRRKNCADHLLKFFTSCNVKYSMLLGLFSIPNSCYSQWFQRCENCHTMVLIIDGFEVEGTLPVSQLFDKYDFLSNKYCWFHSLQTSWRSTQEISLPFLICLFLCATSGSLSIKIHSECNQY